MQAKATMWRSASVWARLWWSLAFSILKSLWPLHFPHINAAILRAPLVKGHVADGVLTGIALQPTTRPGAFFKILVIHSSLKRDALFSASISGEQTDPKPRTFQDGMSAATAVLTADTNRRGSIQRQKPRDISVIGASALVWLRGPENTETCRFLGPGQPATTVSLCASRSTTMHR